MIGVVVDTEVYGIGISASWIVSSTSCLLDTGGVAWRGINLLALRLNLYDSITKIHSHICFWRLVDHKLTHMDPRDFYPRLMVLLDRCETEY